MAKHQKLLIQLIFENKYISNCLPDLEDVFVLVFWY